METDLVGDKKNICSLRKNKKKKKRKLGCRCWEKC